MHKFSVNIIISITLLSLLLRTEGANQDLEIESNKRVNRSLNGVLMGGGRQTIGIFNVFELLLDYFYDDSEENEDGQNYLICENCTVQIAQGPPANMQLASQLAVRPNDQTNAPSNALTTTKSTDDDEPNAEPTTESMTSTEPTTTETQTTTTTGGG